MNVTESASQRTQPQTNDVALEEELRVAAETLSKLKRDTEEENRRKDAASAESLYTTRRELASARLDAEQREAQLVTAQRRVVELESIAFEERDAVIAQLFLVSQERERIAHSHSALQLVEQSSQRRITSLEAAGVMLKAENSRLESCNESLHVLNARLEKQRTANIAQLALLRTASSLLSRSLIEKSDSTDHVEGRSDAADDPGAGGALDEAEMAAPSTPTRTARFSEADKERRKRQAAERERDQAINFSNAMRRTSPIKNRRARDFFGR